MDEITDCWHQLLPAAGWTVHWVRRVCVCVTLIPELVLRCHCREAHGKQHAGLTTMGSAPVGGQHTGYGVLQVRCVLLHSAACTSMLHVLSDWTLGAAAYPSKKSAMSVRRHIKVLADGEG